MTHRRPTNGHHGIPIWLPQVVFGIAAYSIAVTFAGAWWAATMQAANGNNHDKLIEHTAALAAINIKLDDVPAMKNELKNISETLKDIKVAIIQPAPRVVYRTK